MIKAISFLLIMVFLILLSSCSKDLSQPEKIEKGLSQTETGILTGTQLPTPGILYESKELGFKTKLPDNWENYKVIVGESGITFWLPTKDLAWSNVGSEMPGYAMIVGLIFHTHDEWNNFIKNCENVKPEDFGSYFCTEEGIKKMILTKTSTHVITLAFPHDSPSDFEKFYNKGGYNYLDIIRENFEELSSIESIREGLGSEYTSLSYNLSRLDADIKSQESDWKKTNEGLPENSIQYLSKQPGWKKQNVLDFVTALQGKNLNEAIKIYERHAGTISPFLPTCCGFMDYIAHKVFLNGILSLVISGNGLINYSLVYTFYKDGILYEIGLDTGFASSIDPRYKYLLYGENGVYNDKPVYQSDIKTDGINYSFLEDNYNDLLKGWFYSPGENTIFQDRYNKFITIIKNIEK